MLPTVGEQPDRVRPNHTRVIRRAGCGYRGHVAYAVETPVYQGPFDLLLHLILREQVELYDISLCTIVDAYLRELERMEHLDLEIATEFLLIAATLVELKTSACCPATTTSTWTTTCRCGRSATCCSPACSSARPSRRRLRARGVPPGRGPGGGSLRRPRRALHGARPRPARGVTPEQLRAAFIRAATPKPQPRIDLFHVAPIRASVIDAVARPVRRAAPPGSGVVPGPHRLARRAPGGRRALPGHPRAVQAGPGRPAPAAHLRRHRDRVQGGDVVGADALDAIDVYDG